MERQRAEIEEAIPRAAEAVFAAATRRVVGTILRGVAPGPA